jgi:hypothetical protein
VWARHASAAGPPGMLPQTRFCPISPSSIFELLFPSARQQSPSASGGLERFTQVRHRLGPAAGLAEPVFCVVGPQAAWAAVECGLWRWSSRQSVSMSPEHGPSRLRLPAGHIPPSDVDADQPQGPKGWAVSAPPQPDCCCISPSAGPRSGRPQPSTQSPKGYQACHQAC